MKKNFKFILILCSGFLVLFFLSANADREKAELIFSHKQHITDNEIECAVCHENAAISMVGTDNLMPAMEVCGGCHDVESSENCGVCHSDMDNPRNVPRVKDNFPSFSHKMHLDAGLDCQSCHAGIVLKEVVEPYLIPDILSCQNCHIEKKVKPVSHVPNYLHVHGDDVKSDLNAITSSQNCRTCHSTRYCQTCHEGDNLDRVTHPLNYAFTHSMDARGKEQECTVCHAERSFCADCHQQYLVMPHNHVAGWAVPFIGGLHVYDAENDLENCMSCHIVDARQTCGKTEGCHK
ncbi:MAG: hypothetical protein EH225_12295 [Calditrichaeota bacterium]|nr:MAG: hypothetical protein EH225_12295 [Calditrichota bacterium]